MDSESSSPVEVQTVDVHGAKELISSGHRYLDVRTEEEFNKGHVDVENPLNIPYMFNTPQGRMKNPKFMEQVLSVCNKEDPLVVGCQTGVRSVYATIDLLNADFKHVSNMGGGYVAWVENGFAVKNPIYNSPVEVQTVDVYEAKELISSGYRYLDVRTEEEFNKGHVDVEIDPLNIPYMFNTPQGRVKNPKFMEQVLSICNKEDRLVVGCQTGVRSVYATTDLLNADFKHVINMGGGYVAWVENGFAVTKP